MRVRHLFFVLLILLCLTLPAWSQIHTYPPGGGGSGSGTVNSGTAGETAYFSADGTAVSGTFMPLFVTAASDSSLTPDLTTATTFIETALANAITVNAPTNVSHSGQIITFIFKDNATPRAITWNAIFRGGPAATTTASTWLYVLFAYNSSDTKWDLLADSSQVAVTTSGSPSANNLTKFSAAGIITSTDLSGDCSTSGTSVVTCTALRHITRASTTSSATPTPAATTNGVTYYVLTAQAATATFGAPTGSPNNGDMIDIRIKDNGSPQTLDFSNAAFRASSDQPYPTTTTAGKRMRLLLSWDSTDSKWDLLAFLDNI